MKFPMKGYWATAFLLLVVQNSPVHAFKLDTLAMVALHAMPSPCP